ncbi:AAA family ATPase [Aliarcobacter butzleri]|uniref:AAA family ATPase n=1 Tax=Aliarcobacter butzleri TaxID=28197 RepID=UPI003AEDB4B3
MELVYLWVQSYKNIEKQGFNFSPRFRCEYDEEKNELNIIDKDETGEFYPKNFFGDNINVTAIVGENGSGKSSIGEYLFYKEDKEMDKNYILIYYENFLVVDNQNSLVNIKTKLNYVLSPKRISYNEKNIKMIFSFAEHMKPYNHSKISEKDNFIMLGALHEINTYSSEKFNKLLEEFDFFIYKKANKDTRKYSLDGVNYKELSFGEKSILSLCILIEKKIDDNKLNVLFLDEFTLSLHPNWERIIIKKLIDIFKTKNIHFIITSHSPFVLSDIPKQNVIFLEKDEKTGKCINVSDKVDINSFGANIHTLLSHGFFMKDGLMGEFAKEKIDLAIKYLNQKILTEDELNYCENIISIIGEPIIKRELQRKLDSKRLSKIDKIEEIEEQMKLLQNRLEMIRKNQK